MLGGNSSLVTPDGGAWKGQGQGCRCDKEATPEVVFKEQLALMYSLINNFKILIKQFEIQLLDRETS